MPEVARQRLNASPDTASANESVRFGAADLTDTGPIPVRRRGDTADPQPRTDKTVHARMPGRLHTDCPIGVRPCTFDAYWL